MGNCQTIDAAVLVILHPNGKLEEMYWSVSASEVMRKNPDHYVTLIIPLPESHEEKKGEPEALKPTHVKLLKPSDTLYLGSAYRLVPSEEVLSVLRAKKSNRVNTRQVRPVAIPENEMDKQDSNYLEKIPENTAQEDILKAIGKRSRPLAKKHVVRTKSWKPSLKTIAEHQTSDLHRDHKMCDI